MPDRVSRSGLDRLISMASTLAALLVMLVFLHLATGLLMSGLERLSWSFIRLEPLHSGRLGGISHVLMATGIVLAICMLISIPVSFGCALWIQDRSRSSAPRAKRWLQRCLDLLAGLPSIVFGLFGMALFCHQLRMGYSILAGGLTLACMVLPLQVRLASDALERIPGEYLRGAAALGLSRVRTLWHIVFPTALPGLMAGLLLSLGRAASETAALLFTSGYVTRRPTSLLDSGRTLPVHIYDLAMNVPGGEASANASAVVLMACLLVINVAAMHLAGRWRQTVSCE